MKRRPQKKANNVWNTRPMKDGKYTGDYPVIYFKVVSGSISAYLSLTHDYLRSLSTEAEAKEWLESVYIVRDKEGDVAFLNHLIQTSSIRVGDLVKAIKPAYSKVKGSQSDENDSMFRGAWWLGTFQFYEKHPDLERYEEIEAKAVQEVQRKDLAGKGLGPVRKIEDIPSEKEAQEEVNRSEVKSPDGPKKSKKEILAALKSRKKSEESATLPKEYKPSASTKRKDILSRLKKKKKKGNV